MKKLIIIVFAVVLFSSCAKDEPTLSTPGSSGNSMFGVHGFYDQTADTNIFHASNTTYGTYLQFKADAEVYYNMKMNDVNVMPDGIKVNSTITTSGKYYGILWNPTYGSFNFSWSK